MMPEAQRVKMLTTDSYLFYLMLFSVLHTSLSYFLYSTQK